MGRSLPHPTMPVIIAQDEPYILACGYNTVAATRMSSQRNFEYFIVRYVRNAAGGDGVTIGVILIEQQVRSGEGSSLSHSFAGVRFLEDWTALDPLGSLHRRSRRFLIPLLTFLTKAQFPTFDSNRRFNSSETTPTRPQMCPSVRFSFLERIFVSPILAG
jgi:hypothetical protein